MIQDGAVEALAKGMAKEFGMILHTDDQTWRNSARAISAFIEQQGYIVVAGSYPAVGSPPQPSDPDWS